MRLRTPLPLWCASFLATLGAIPAGCGGQTFEPQASGSSSGAASSSGGSSGASTSGSSSGGSSSGTPAPRYPCENPQAILGTDTGFVQCASGFVHRESVHACPSSLPTALSCTFHPPGPDGGPTGCSSDSDCTEHPNGYCSLKIQDGVLPYGCKCYYGCQTDADCGAGQLCLCGGLIGQCVPASCQSDADCSPGLLCTMSAPLGTCPQPPPFACQTPADTCGGPSDCATPSGETCGYNNGVHQCVQQCVFGRPFLVLGAARTAATERRADWQARGVEPSVEELTAAQREALAGAWADTAAMEHASIAAFARFALQLLSVGAPASLVEGAHEAMRDETEHAKLCFALASRYAGRPMGPSALRVQGALAELDPESILTTTILEGCIGEMVAAIEAAEALQHTRDPAVRAVLAKIAEDETRHAELAWRYLRWATARDPQLRALAERTFAFAIANAKPATAAGGDDPTETRLAFERLAFGVVSDGLRAEIRARVLREVVAPCAEAILGRAGNNRRRTLCDKSNARGTRFIPGRVVRRSRLD